MTLPGKEVCGDGEDEGNDGDTESNVSDDLQGKFFLLVLLW